jgi:trehalose-6-phosphatase
MDQMNNLTLEFPGIPDFWRQVRNANDRFLGLDYDGTLAPFAIDPMQAKPLPGIADLFRDLVAGGQTQVAIISGRPVAEVMTLLNNPPVTIIGSHGYEHCSVGGRCVVRQPTSEQLQGLLEIQSGIQRRNYGCKLAAVAVEEEIAATWGVLALRYTLECRRFNGGVEFRCSGWNKGDALITLLDRQPEDALAVYLGDDETDEDAFAVIRGRGVGIKVGDPFWPTAAQGYLPNCQAVAGFLQHWAAITATDRRQ